MIIMTIMTFPKPDMLITRLDLICEISLKRAPWICLGVIIEYTENVRVIL